MAWMVDGLQRGGPWMFGVILAMLVGAGAVLAAALLTARTKKLRAPLWLLPALLPVLAGALGSWTGLGLAEDVLPQAALENQATLAQAGAAAALITLSFGSVGGLLLLGLAGALASLVGALPGREKVPWGRATVALVVSVLTGLALAGVALSGGGAGLVLVALGFLGAGPGLALLVARGEDSEVGFELRLLAASCLSLMPALGWLSGYSGLEERRYHIGASASAESMDTLQKLLAEIATEELLVGGGAAAALLLSLILGAVASAPIRRTRGAARVLVAAAGVVIAATLLQALLLSRASSMVDLWGGVI